MRAEDMTAVFALAALIHPGFPEDDDVLAEIFRELVAHVADHCISASPGRVRNDDANGPVRVAVIGARD